MEQLRLSEQQKRLFADYQAFVNIVDGFSEEQFKQHIGEKWAVADVVQHLYLSARPVARLMAGSRDVLLQWGKPDGESRAYDAISLAYQQRLRMGVKAPEPFTPRPEDMQADKRDIIERLVTTYQAIIEALNNWTDQELDDYVIPHPALGKLTVREMIQFISIHTQHHLRLLPK
ncbi:DinB family protein [Spirosoma sp.]|uniref:DinB family protein n=1 Tax=Spirosoma sp. TaxID=1899569 RepID=UPI003B3A2E26